ncbi:MAG: hypothetical protein C4K49_01315 [Candidatus Thorarchaeota archaeon]|nr:MAG: hypothetical protein C4K49_01315 [Candidatus Thorarchaeota archaeon]
MIELMIILALSGIILVISALLRLRKVGKFRSLGKTIEGKFDVKGLDLSGRTEYADCFSHDWYIRHMTGTQHGRMGEWFQRQMMERTIATFLWFGVLLGCSAMLIGLLVFSSLRLLQVGALVLFFAVLLVIGSGGVNVSEQLLAALLQAKPDEYRRDDYAYVRISIRTIMTWSLFCLAVGIVFLVSAPFDTLLFDVLGTGIMLFGDAVLWGPMLRLFLVWAPLGVIYISLVVPFIFIIVPLVIYSAYRRIRYGSA